jgi:hypothetical protein
MDAIELIEVVKDMEDSNPIILLLKERDIAAGMDPGYIDFVSKTTATIKFFLAKLTRIEEGLKTLDPEFQPYDYFKEKATEAPHFEEYPADADELLDERGGPDVR